MRPARSPVAGRVTIEGQPPVGEGADAGECPGCRTGKVVSRLSRWHPGVRRAVGHVPSREPRGHSLRQDIHEVSALPIGPRARPASGAGDGWRVHDPGRCAEGCPRRMDPAGHAPVGASSGKASRSGGSRRGGTCRSRSSASVGMTATLGAMFSRPRIKHRVAGGRRSPALSIPRGDARRDRLTHGSCAWSACARTKFSRWAHMVWPSDRSACTRTEFRHGAGSGPVPRR